MKKLIFLYILFFQINNTSGTEYMNMRQHPTPPILLVDFSVIGRKVSNLSISPDGKDFFYLEAIESQGNENALFKYDQINKALFQYVLPKGYAYINANLSPSGQYIVLTRHPKAVENGLSNEEAWGRMEIVLIKLDDFSLQKLRIKEGFFTFPAVSLDGKKIAYWRGNLRDKNSKSVANKYDIYEYHIDEKIEKLFSKKYEFFESGRILYLNDDKSILTSAFGVMDSSNRTNSIADRSQSEREFSEKFQDSHIYRFERDKNENVFPYFMGARNANHPVPTMDGGMYFYGEIPGKGVSLVKVDSYKSIKYWVEPHYLSKSTKQLLRIPNTDDILLVYQPINSKNRTDSALLRIHVESNTWEQVKLPSGDKAKAIFIKSFGGEI
jgi:hypothetical protein